MSSLRLKLFSFIFLSTAPFLLLFYRLNWLTAATAPNLFATQLIATVASITGLVGAVLMFWQIALGVRFIAVQFTSDVMNLNRVHKWLGIFSFFLILLHPLFNMIAYKRSLAFIFIPNFSTEFNSSVSYGIVAFLLLIAVFLSSAVLKSKLPYRWWHYFHLSTYLIVGLVLLHARVIGTMLNTIPLLSNLWWILSALLPLIICMRLFQWLGYLKKKYRVVKIRSLTTDVFELTIQPITSTVSPRVGQYVYLQRRRGGEAHPFTVMKYDPKTNHLSFGIKKSGPYTSLLAQIKSGDTVFVDGPYGVFTAEAQNENPKVLLAGGIGITPFVQIITRFGNQNTYLFYSTRYFAETIFHTLFKKVLGENYVVALTKDSHEDSQIIHERLNAAVIQEKLPKDIFETANFFICGPQAFYKGLKTSLLQAGVPQSRVYHEMFEL